MSMTWHAVLSESRHCVLCVPLPAQSMPCLQCKLHTCQLLPAATETSAECQLLPLPLLPPHRGYTRKEPYAISIWTPMAENWNGR
jgi:hypothetical protein